MNQTKTLILKDRQILISIDGKKCSYPVANLGDILQASNVFGSLNEKGVEAWNNGEEMNWMHLDIVCDIKLLEKDVLW